MKKKFIVCTIAALLSTFALIAADYYYYGFILSCGKTAYGTFDYELSEPELLFWTDYFEKLICEGQTNPNPEIGGDYV